MTEASGTSLSNPFDDPRVQALRMAEINPAGTLHQFLSKRPNLRYAEYGSLVFLQVESWLSAANNGDAG